MSFKEKLDLYSKRIEAKREAKKKAREAEEKTQEELCESFVQQSEKLKEIADTSIVPLLQAVQEKFQNWRVSCESGASWQRVSVPPYVFDHVKGDFKIEKGVIKNKKRGSSEWEPPSATATLDLYIESRSSRPPVGIESDYDMGQSYKLICKVENKERNTVVHIISNRPEYTGREKSFILRGEKNEALEDAILNTFDSLKKSF